MKKLLFLSLLLSFVTVCYPNGVVIVDAGSGTYFTLKNSVVSVEVNNQVAIVTSKQLFINNTGKSQKVKYGFPMPKSGTATQLRWKIEDEWTYANFKVGEQNDTLPGTGGGSSPNSSLISYLGETPLYFDLSDTLDANQEIEIEITYVQLLEYKFNIVSFSYTSDYSLIQSSFIEQTQSLDFLLHSDRTIYSFDIENYSPTITNDGNVAELSMAEYESVSVSDYIITYELASDELGIVDFSTYLPDSLQTCDSLGNGYLGLIIEPESNENTDVIEKVFTLIVDESGSMSGNKIVQARDAASFIMNNLNEGDYFNIINFSSDVNSFKPDHVEFNMSNKNEALNYISQIEAGGGTNISDALSAAINQFDVVNSGKANIIIFFTDGEATAGLTNTQGILDIVSDVVLTKETEVFLYTFGIGSYANEQLLTLLANNNNGLSAFVGDEEVESMISDFYLTIRNPVLLNTKIDFEPDIISEIYPQPYPNLYKGMQLILAGRYSDAQVVKMTLTGKAFNSDVSYTYDIDLADTVNSTVMFMPKLWAKKKIEQLTNEFYAKAENSSEADSIKTVIENMSVCYQVISQFTSFTDEDVFSTEMDELDSEAVYNLYSFFPNPFSNEIRIVIHLRVIQNINIKIYDVTGKLIKVFDIDGEPGENIIEWNGKDENNKMVTSGVYFYQLKIGQRQYMGKIIKR